MTLNDPVAAHDSDSGSATVMTKEDEEAMAIEMRVRLLETLVGLDTALAQRPNAQDASVARRSQAVIAGIYDALDRHGTDAVKRFLETYDLNKALLVPQLPAAMANGTDLTANAKAALILDSESDLRTLDRELREIDTLEKRGMAGAGQLQDHIALQSRLKVLNSEVASLAGTYSSLETRVESLLAQYDDYINTVSQLFVNWNDVITNAEKDLTRFEKARASQ